MNNIHPDWVLTDTHSSSEQSAPTAIEEHESERIPIAGLDVSRRPAAIVGILVVIGTGIGFFFGTNALTGQLATEIDVTITNSGIEPKQITVNRGASIRWKNEQDIPHTIKSQNLCDRNRICLETETIFPGESKSAVIPSAIQLGTYTYYSEANDSVAGVIVITDAHVQKTTPSTTKKSFAEYILGGDLDALVDSIDEQKRIESQPLASVDPLVEENNPLEQKEITKLPNNPNTVDSKRTNPIEQVEKYHDSQDIGHNAAANITGKNKRFHQPKTGPGMWIVLILGLLSGWKVISLRTAR